MSYILDALKKSDQQRQLQTRTREKQRWQISDTPVRKRKPIWLPVAVLVVGTVTLSSWLHGTANGKAPKTIQEFVPISNPEAIHNNSDKGTADTHTTSLNPEQGSAEIQPEALKVQPNLASPELLKKKQGQLREQMLSYQQAETPAFKSAASPPSQPDESPDLIKAATNATIANNAFADNEVNEQAPTVDGDTSEPPQALESESQQEQQASFVDPHPLALSILHLSELPPSVAQQLPRFDVSVSIFSTSATNRRARINGQMYYQGDSLTEKLTLYEITPKSLIFDFEGQLFRVSL